MKGIFLSIPLFFLLFHAVGQRRYSFGTDYSLLFSYPRQDPGRLEHVIQYGIAGTSEISLKSSILTGINYYAANIGMYDSVRSNKYLEIPLILKTNFSIFDRVFKPHITSGIGVNFLIRDQETKIKSEAINFILGIGVDIKIHKAFYLSFDTILKGYHFLGATINRYGDKAELVPVSKGGIFVWLNR